MRELVVVTGASGAGKTTMVEAVEQSAQCDVDVFYFDSIGVPPVDDMIAEFGSTDEWQRAATRKWVNRILESSNKDVAVLDGQIRLSYIDEACKDLPCAFRIVLVDCNDDVRTARLGTRGQSELASPDMMNWAAFLRSEAEENDRATVLDTSEMTVEGATTALLEVLGVRDS